MVDEKIQAQMTTGFARPKEHQWRLGVPPSPAADAVAQLNADTDTRLDRALDSASQANRKMEFWRLLAPLSWFSCVQYC